MKEGILKLYGYELKALISKLEKEKKSYLEIPIVKYYNTIFFIKD